MIEDIDLDNGQAPEPVRLYLCRPDRTIIAELKEAYGIQLTLHYGGLSQLAFKVPYTIPSDMKHVKNRHIKLLRGDYAVKYTQGSETDYFIITKPQHIASQGIEYVDVACQQLPYEWKDKIIRQYKGTKRFYDSAGGEGLLNETLLQKTDWQVGYVDSEIASKVRTFEESRKSLLEFIIEASDKYGGAIPVWDTISKRVSFYKEENLGVDEGLVIENGHYLKSIESEENFEDIVTRLYVYGKDDKSIHDQHPSGGPFIESFDFYMYPFERDAARHVTQHSDYMSDSLCHAILDYQAVLASKTEEFHSLLSHRGALVDSKIPLKVELDLLKQQLELILKKIDAEIAANRSLGSLNADKDAKQAEVNVKEQQLGNIDSQIATVDHQLTALKNHLSLANHFTPEQIVERNRFIKESVWQDNNYTSSSELFEEGKRKLATLSQPLVHYKVDSVDFLQALNTPQDWNRLKIGCIVTIRYPNFGIDIKAKIITIEHDLDANSIRLTIANTKDIKSGFLKMKDLLQRSYQSSVTVDMSKYKWDKSEANASEIGLILNNAWDANKRAIQGGDNESYSLDQRGLTLKSPADANNFLRAVHNCLAFTNDGGNSYKNALTPQGLNAETVVGVLGVFAKLKANQIVIGDSGEKIGDGLIQSSANWNNKVSQGIVYNGVKIDAASGLVVTRDDNAVKSTFNASQGIRIQKNVAGTWTDKFFYNANTGNLSLNGDISVEGSFKVNGEEVLTGDKKKLLGAFIDKIKVEQLDATSAKIKAAQIESLVVGSNVTMGANATISWSNVTNQPYIPTVPGYITATKITSTSIESPTISAGTLTGAIVQTAANGHRIMLSGTEFGGFNGLTRHGVVINSATAQVINFYDNGTSAGSISVIPSSGKAINISTYNSGFKNDINILSDRDINLQAFNGGSINFANKVDFSLASITGLNLKAVLG